MAKYKVIFIGTGDFGIPILDKLLTISDYDVVAVVTQPDKPAGRDLKLKASSIKKFVLESKLDMPILQPEKIKEIAQNLLDNFKPDLIVVAAYGQIIPKTLLEGPKFGAVNLHGSILPKLRGAVPVPMAILFGLTKTGVTLQKMVYAMDAGPIIHTQEIEIAPTDTTETLMSKLSHIAAKMTQGELLGWLRGEIKETNQDESLATFCYKEDISKDKAEISKDTDIILAERKIRAFYPWPVSWIKLESGKVLKIFKASIKEVAPQPRVKLLQKEDKSLVLVLNSGKLMLDEVQLEGKTRQKGSNYLFLAD